MQNNADATGGGAISTPPVVSTGVDTSGGTGSASEDKADDSPSPEKGNPIVVQRRTGGEQNRLDSYSVSVFVDENACD